MDNWWWHFSRGKRNRKEGNCKFLIAICLIASMVFACSKTSRKQPAVTQLHDQQNTKTNTIKIKETSNFIFSVKTMVDAEFGIPEKVFAEIMLKSDSSVWYLFECHALFGNAEYLEQNFMEHVTDNLWWFPYFTGGNYCRATGYNLIAIQQNSVKYLGQLGGYEDINGDSLKEFWVYVVTDDLDKSCSEYVIEKLKVDMIEDNGFKDTLSYPFEGGY
jgi:hypothetical protein